MSEGPLYNLENIFCASCGLSSSRIYITRETCPHCPCAVCDKKGHAAETCPTATACPHCGRTTHKPSLCPQTKLRPSPILSFKEDEDTENPEAGASENQDLEPEQEELVPKGKDRLDSTDIPQNGSGTQDAFAANTSLRCYKGGVWRGRGGAAQPRPLKQGKHGNLNVSVAPERGFHNDDLWIKTTQDNKQTEPPQFPAMTFPNLTTECKKLLQDIVSRKLTEGIGATEQLYIDEIQSRGCDAVVSCLVGMVDPAIVALQGKRINPSNLREVIATQKGRRKNLWPHFGGYLDAVLSEQDSSYMRPYVGQSFRMRRRIINEHLQKILEGDYTALHYYILWLGNNDRSANFVLLWAAPDDAVKDEWLELCFNLLEALFCRIFRSHHGCLLPKGQSTDRQLGWGLNIMSPLQQGQVPGYQHRLRERGRLATSPDPDIKHWATFRAKTLSAKEIDTWVPPTPWTAGKYHDALVESVGADVLQALRSPMSVSAMSAERLPIQGSMKAMVAFVLSSDSHDLRTEEESTHPSEHQPSLPWVLERSGFTNNDVLVWSHGSEFRGSQDLHQKILRLSHARLIVLCGVFAQDAVKAAMQKAGGGHHNLIARNPLNIKSHKYPVFEATNNFDQKRVILHCDSLPARGGPQMGYKRATSLCEIIKLCGLIPPKFLALRPYFIQSRCVLTEVFRQRELEKLGTPPWTVDTISPAIRVWLSTKGFRGHAELKKLEDLASPMSLVYGILMFLQVQPRRSTGVQEARATKRLNDSKERVRTRNGGLEADKMSLLKEFLQEKVVGDEQRWQKAKDDQPITALVATCTGETRKSRDTDSLDVNSEEEISIGEEDSIENEVEQGTQRIAMTMVDAPDVNDQASDNAADDNFPENLRKHLVLASKGGSNESSSLYTSNPSSMEWTEQTEKVERINWSAEGDKFRGKPYPRKVQHRRKEGNMKQISIWALRLPLPNDLDFGNNGRAYVYIEDFPKHLMHPKRWAQNATEDDVCGCIAFRVVGEDSNGDPWEFYPTTHGKKDVFQGNSFVDMLLDHKTMQEIGEKSEPRRMKSHKVTKEIDGEMKSSTMNLYTSELFE